MSGVEETHDSGRKPYKGSCHCGFVKYIIYLSLPPPALSLPARSSSGASKTSVRIRKVSPRYATNAHLLIFASVQLQYMSQDGILPRPTTQCAEGLHLDFSTGSNE
jgi:hypothetical protein